MLAEFFEQGEGHRGVIDELAICRLTDDPADDQLGVIAGGKAAVFEDGIDFLRILEFENRFDRAAFLAGADQRFFRAFAEDEFERSDNDGFSGARFSGHADEPRAEFPGEFVNEGEIADFKKGEHSFCGTPCIMQVSPQEAMAAEFSLTFLGTGTSVGVPVIGCDCPVCTSDDPRNQRFRSSVVVRAGGQTLLVDTGPDLRMQALREGLREIDAVIYTHAHLDHVAGFDELRAFCWHKPGPLPLHATEGCMETLKGMFGWAFFPQSVIDGYVRPEVRVIDGPFFYGDLKVTPLPVEHAAVETIGFLFEYPGSRRVAYLPDVKRIPQETMEKLQGIDVLIIDALRTAGHPTHFSLTDALKAASDLRADETWLTHLSHEYDAATLSGQLPSGVRMAVDGLQISL